MAATPTMRVWQVEATSLAQVPLAVPANWKLPPAAATKVAQRSCGAEAPREPRFHTTLLPEAWPPAVADLKVRPVGMGTVTVAPAAGVSPVLLTVKQTSNGRPMKRSSGALQLSASTGWWTVVV